MALRTYLLGMIPCLTAAAALAVSPQVDVDTDGDGISDRHEQILGIDPTVPQAFQVVLDDGPESDQRRAASDYDATKDFSIIDNPGVLKFLNVFEKDLMKGH